MSAHTYNIVNADTGNVHTTLIAQEPIHAAHMFLIRNEAAIRPHRQALLYYSDDRGAIVEAHDRRSSPLFYVRLVD